MNTSEATVFIVDDDLSVRRSLARLMKSSGYRSETFASAQEFLDTGRHRDGSGCLVLDVRMPGLNGLELQHELARVVPTLPIIFITGHGDIPMSVQAMKEGAVDFLPKPFQSHDLLQAVATALERNAHERMESAERRRIQERVDTLTPREREVMALVVTGMLNKQVAGRLGTTEKTIKVHRSRVMEKMGVESLAELVHAAARVGIPPPRSPSSTPPAAWA